MQTQQNFFKFRHIKFSEHVPRLFNFIYKNKSQSKSQEMFKDDIIFLNYLAIHHENLFLC